MRRLLPLVLACSLSLCCLSACGDDTAPVQPSDTPDADNPPEDTTPDLPEGEPDVSEPDASDVLEAEVSPDVDPPDALEDAEPTPDIIEDIEDEPDAVEDVPLPQDVADADPPEDAEPDAPEDVVLPEDAEGEPDTIEDTVPDADEVEIVEAQVDTQEGPVVGALEGEPGVWVWKGIPFAAPPTGDLRWRSPQNAPVRDTPLDATTFGLACPQDNLPGSERAPGQGEDCLYLNVWTPEGAERGALPVMVWVHGGAFSTGSGSQNIYEGAPLATEGVVVVTINYRLGALGFMSHESLVGDDPDYPGAGNYGLLDQIAALGWVRDNIEGFGGDPERVTVFGESAGGSSVCALMVSPLSEGLFARAIMQSGFCPPALPHMTDTQGNIEPASAQGERLGEALECADDEDVIACMRGKTLAQVNAAVRTLPGLLDIGTLAKGFGLVIDDHALFNAPRTAMLDGQMHDVDLLAGTNSDEGSVFATPFRIDNDRNYADLLGLLFGPLGPLVLGQYPPGDYDSPRDAYNAVLRDAFFLCPTRFAVRQQTLSGHTAWLYSFTHVTAFGRERGIGSFHASEMPFVFGTLEAFYSNPTEAEQALSDQIRALWATFAAEGLPEAEGIEWTPYDLDRDQILEIAIPSEEIDGRDTDRCGFWVILGG